MVKLAFHKVEAYFKNEQADAAIRIKASKGSADYFVSI
jgi:hypothetical protein